MPAPHIFHHLLTHACAWMHTARRTALAVRVLAAVTGCRLTVTALGRSLASQAQEKHGLKRADRRLSHRHLHAERVRGYTALGRWRIGSTSRSVMIDGSEREPSQTHVVLRASLPLRGRAFTVYAEGHTAQTTEKPQTPQTFLARLQRGLPTGCPPLISTDAGLRTPGLRQVAPSGWAGMGRVRQRHTVQCEAQGRWVACPSLSPQATRPPQALGAVRFPASNPLAGQCVLDKAQPTGRRQTNRVGPRVRASHREKHAARQREPWLFATSFPVRAPRATQVGSLSARRMQSEEACRDLKSSRVGVSLASSGTRHWKRLQVFLLRAALALYVLWLRGKAAELTAQHWHYQANTVRKRTVLSTICIGFQVRGDARVTVRKDHIHAAARALRELLQTPMSDY